MDDYFAEAEEHLAAVQPEPAAARGRHRRRAPHGRRGGTVPELPFPEGYLGDGRAPRGGGAGPRDRELPGVDARSAARARHDGIRGARRRGARSGAGDRRQARRLDDVPGSTPSLPGWLRPAGQALPPERATHSAGASSAAAPGPLWTVTFTLSPGSGGPRHQGGYHSGAAGGDWPDRDVARGSRPAAGSRSIFRSWLPTSGIRGVAR